MSEERRDVLEGLGGYTPGPWRPFVTIHGTNAVFAPDGKREVVAWAGFDSSDVPAPERPHNTHLIARAPELVEEVTRLREQNEQLAAQQQGVDELARERQEENDHLRTLARELYGALENLLNPKVGDLPFDRCIGSEVERAQAALHRAREAGIGGESDG